MKHHVTVVPHDPNWARLFEEERNVIADRLGETALNIEHIGSTAIPGIVAKPILDMMVGVDALTALDEKAVSALQEAGYVYRGDAGVPDRHFFKKESGLLTYHLHIAATDDTYWEEKILFRDYLRNHREAAQAYERLKRELAEQFAGDRSTYTKHKTPFVEEILKLAKAEARAGGST